MLKCVSKAQKPQVGFYKGNFISGKLQDTYFRHEQMEHRACLGKWYLPWPLLEHRPYSNYAATRKLAKKGKNEVVVFDLFGNAKPQLTFLYHLILDEVNEQQAQTHKKAGQKVGSPGCLLPRHF